MEDMNQEGLKKLEKIISEVIKAIDPSLKFETATNITQESVIISLSGEELGKLIGYHGRSLYSLEDIFRIVFHHEVSHEMFFELDINQYKEGRKNVLFSMAQRIGNEALKRNTVVSFPPMRASERKYIHQIVATIEGVSSESEGEGYQRRVVVKPKDNSLFNIES